MNKVQSKRLLNVARALREAHAAKKKFDMEKLVFGHEAVVERNDDGTVVNPEADFCGTPACAIGHYAARTDLQRILKIIVTKENGVPTASVVRFGTQYDELDYYDEQVWRDHFGLEGPEEMEVLFGFDGCGGARTALQAAKFIERYVQKALYPGRNTTRNDYY